MVTKRSTHHALEQTITHLLLQRGRAEVDVRVGYPEHLQLLAAVLQLLDVQYAVRHGHRVDVGQI